MDEILEKLTVLSSSDKLKQWGKDNFESDIESLFPGNAKTTYVIINIMYQQIQWRRKKVTLLEYWTFKMPKTKKQVNQAYAQTIVVSPCTT